MEVYGDYTHVRSPLDGTFNVYHAYPSKALCRGFSTSVHT